MPHSTKSGFTLREEGGSFSFKIVVVCCSAARLCLTLGLHGLQHAGSSALHYLLESAQIHIHY